MQPIITLKDISARYGSKIVLENIHLTVYDHDFLGVIGPNGGGKTTLMHIILGLMKPCAGKVRYYKDGKEVKELSIGYLPQYNDIDPQFPISAYEVVLSGLNKQKRPWQQFTKQHYEMVEETLSRLGLTALRQRPIGTLSGGQLQRVLLGRAIVSKPQVVILDEPNTYIDTAFQKEMYDILGEINQDCAIIIVSHDTSLLKERAKHLVWVNRKIELN